MRLLSLSLLASAALLLASALAPVATSTQARRTAPEAATAAELAAVTGMAFQVIEPAPRPPREPQTWQGQCCKKAGGNTCSPRVTPITHCSSYSLGACFSPGATCSVKLDGPWKDDACTTAGARPGHHCTMKYDGDCAQYQWGECTTEIQDPFYICRCVLMGSPFGVGWRSYCDAASTGSNDCP